MVRVEENISDGRLKWRERKLLSESGLKLQGIEKKVIVKSKKDTPLRILVRIMDYTRKVPTVYSVNGEHQCDSRRSRSMGDLFKLMKYYYPEITFKQLRALVFELTNTNCIGISYCNTIHKLVTYKPYMGIRPRDYGIYVGGDHLPDEFGFTLKIIRT